jgi:hypothetical protein
MHMLRRNNLRQSIGLHLFHPMHYSKRIQKFNIIDAAGDANPVAADVVAAEDIVAVAIRNQLERRHREERPPPNTAIASR